MPGSLTPQPSRAGETLRTVIGWGYRMAVTTRGIAGRFDGGSALSSVTALSHRPAIIMIPGFQGPASNFLYLYQHLRRTLGSSFDLAVVDNCDPMMGLSPDENAGRLDEFLAARHLKGRDLYLIGHSMGGLVARRYLHWPGAAPGVRGLVMIATPNGGVNCSNMVPLHWARSMGFHQRFNEAFPPTRRTRYLLMSGTRGLNLMEGYPNDGVVGCWSVREFARCYARHAEVLERTYPLSHMELLLSKQVSADITGFLRATHAAGEIIPRPAPGRCPGLSSSPP